MRFLEVVAALLSFSTTLLHGQIINETERIVPEYNETLAVKLFHFAAATYGDRREECTKRATGADSDWVVFLQRNQMCDVTGKECGLFIAHSDKEQHGVIAFRGTEGLLQLFNQGWQGTFPAMQLDGMGNVFRYFLEAHWDTWRVVEDYLRLEEYKNYTISFTGHSLGGALASLAAVRSANMGLRSADKLRLYTFGEPRVGKVDLARKIDELVPESYRIVNALDLVPHLPFCRNRIFSSTCPDSGAYHHGTEIWYASGMEIGQTGYKVCNGSPVNEDTTCSNGKASMLVSNLVDRVAHHRRYFGVMGPDVSESRRRREKCLPVAAMVNVSGMIRDKSHLHESVLLIV